MLDNLGTPADSEQLGDSRFGIVTAAIIAIIIYGSLYPFDFYSNPNPAGPVRALLSTYSDSPHHGDFLANILLYVPFGFCAFSLLRRQPPWTRVLLVTLSGFALSTGLELLQFYDLGRDSAMVDVYANTAGTILGVLAGSAFRRRIHLPIIGTIEKRPYVILLLICWLGYRLYPFAPVTDLHKYWVAIKPLVQSPTLPLSDLYRHTTIWLTIALLLETLVGTARARVAFLLFVPAVLAARILILDVVLSPAEVAGGLIALLAWNALLWHLRIRAVLLAVLFAGVVVVQALEPFKFSAPPRAFQWIPLYGFLHGSIEANTRSLLEKSFTYGALAWLMVRAGWPLKIAALTGGALVLCLRFSEVYIPGRSAEITDTIIFGMFALVMRKMAEDSLLRVEPPESLRAGPTTTSSYRV